MANSQTDVFRHLVRTHMAPPPVVVPPGTCCAEVVAVMARTGASAAIIVDAAHGILGILTDRDVTARIACRDVAGEPVDGLMTAPVLTVRDNEQLYKAIGFMRRRELRHMPVVDGEGALCGMLDLHEALAVATGPLAGQIDRLTHEEGFEGLAQVKAAQVLLAEELFADNVPAPEILSLISDINNDIHRRCLRLLVAELEAEGRGGPPVGFACIVMGSGGRGESSLFPDQDNGFILADYPDEEHETVDPWFIALAERMVRALDQLGIPLCRGGIMAINPLWRKSLSQWQQQIRLWMRARSEVMLLHADAFFDFRRVYGDSGLAEALSADVTAAAAGNRFFLRELFEIHAEHRVGIGLFSRLLTERGTGELNLKLQGTLPLAEGVRLLALAHGVPPAGTLARLAALRERGVIARDDADHLEGAFAYLTGLQLHQQISDFRAGRPVSNHLRPDDLTERERDLLRASLRAINAFRARIRTELTGALLG